MKIKCTCTLTEQKTIHHLPDSWMEADYRDLLNYLDVDDVDAISASDLTEMALMALQDNEPLHASEKLLTNRLSDILSPGQIKNCAQELRDEPLWEEYPEPSAHRRFFVCQDILSRAFPGIFQTPEATSLVLQVEASRSGVLHDPLDQEMVVRLLAGGMDDRSILTRMYEDQLKGGPFSEAASILWDCDTLKVDGPSATVQVVSSVYWMRGLPDEGSYEVELDLPGGDD